MRVDSATRGARWRLPVTAGVLASAFHDAPSRVILTRARRARTEQDSSLESYDAMSRQRISVGAAIGKFGPERLVYRRESSARVQWQRGRGARIELTGARVAAPMLPDGEQRKNLIDGLADDEMSPIPYFPGSESMWIGGLSAQTEVSESELVNPLAVGAEAYYTYESGQSLSFRLPDGRTIQLEELKVRPRAPKMNLSIGSLWFDSGSGQLVRAVYRLATPARMTVGVTTDDSANAAKGRTASLVIEAIMSPMTAYISSVVVEYGLYGGGRFWLPRVQSLEGVAQVMFARVPVRMENAFSYASVNAALNLATITVDTTTNDRAPRMGRPPAGLDSAARRRWRDSTRAAYTAAVTARADSVRAGLRIGTMRQCDTSATRTITRFRYDASIPVELRIPCDVDKLTTSPDLPASIYDRGEALFGSADAERMIAEALSLGAQAPLSLGALPRPRFQIGPSMTRYNRVEGFSTGFLVEQQLGAGLSVTGIARLGVADVEPNIELSLARSNLSRTVRVNGYNRLVSANDWGEPLSFRSSLAALLFGRDEGFYYRASGAELTWASERGARVEWRAFAERQRGAPQQTGYSVGGTFTPNIAAASGLFAGGSMRLVRGFGVDPFGFRAFTDLRLEAARGDSAYGRGALDVTLSRAFSKGAAVSLSLAGGNTVGHVPAQRRWFLGGTQTIRGQSADTAQSGTAFWLGHFEVARPSPIVRAALFADIGWTGDRANIGEVGRPLSGVGIGLSAFDGLVRFDVARGLYPREQTRVALYFGSRF